MSTNLLTETVARDTNYDHGYGAQHVATYLV